MVPTRAAFYSRNLGMVQAEIHSTPNSQIERAP